MVETRSQTKHRESEQKQKQKQTELTHPEGWTRHLHYFNFGCYCGQSCPCCRALVGDTLGACPICLENRKKSLQFS